jgi:CheY-like chemotaxis protein
MPKTALIVDDSASARFVLGGMLSEQSLLVDTAASGEEALEYLRHARPDVIFMDHLMPGMDGFQALEAIKENPATATIPVMMYTSQEGELYVGQARALGAIGVLPKQVHPVEVTKVLDALHLTPDTAGQPTADPATEDGGDSSRVNALLAELFKEQREVLQDDIRRGYEHVAETTVSQRQLDLGTGPDETRSGLLILGLAILAATTVVFAYLYYDSQYLLAQANSRISLLADGVRTDVSPPAAVATELSAAAVDSTAVLDLLEWGLSQAENYPFTETALNDRRAQMLTAIAQRLRSFGIEATIVVDVHVGRHCMSPGPDGVLILPPAAQLLVDCQQIGRPEAEALAYGAQQTLPFANAIALESRDGTVRFEIVSHGASQPQSAYPSFTQGLTAGEWNEIAASNQRVEVSILPE